MKDELCLSVRPDVCLFGSLSVQMLEWFKENGESEKLRRINLLKKCRNVGKLSKVQKLYHCIFY